MKVGRQAPIEGTYRFPAAVRFDAHYIDGMDLFLEGKPDSTLLCCSAQALNRFSLLSDWVKARKSNCHVYENILPNPTLEPLVDFLRRSDLSAIGSIIAVGGGSVMDVAKVMSQLANVNSDLDSIQEQVKRDDIIQFHHQGLPVLLVPTTVGSGAEVTPFATIWLGAEKEKRSFVVSDATNRVVVNDSKLLAMLPPEQIMLGGLDCISHALESIWNRNSTEITCSLAVRALSLVVDNLNEAIHVPSAEVLQKLQVASNAAGLAISVTRTAIAHACSYPLTAKFGVPHGLACSVFLLDIISENREALLSMVPDAALVRRTEYLLESFELKEKLARYLGDYELANLKSEMLKSSRARNYIFSPEDFIKGLSLSQH